MQELFVSYSPVDAKYTMLLGHAKYLQPRTYSTATSSTELGLVYVSK
jgi:hypothetical protein